MLIYENNGKIYCYIHIPKNSGRFIRDTIKRYKNNKIIKSYWDCNKNFDFAHIPFILRKEYTNFLKEQNICYYTYTRNPYNRIISGFFYKRPNSNKNQFKLFVKNELIKYDFNTTFNKNIIHYYPQYMFICNDDFQINEVEYKKLENQDFNIKEYNLSDYFDLETIKIINEVYLKDFELLNYELKWSV
jgi:hypothetical protein